jgi:hypothetical protein
MTDAELDAIQQRAQAARECLYDNDRLRTLLAVSGRDVPELVAEVQRLRAGLQFVRDELLG